MIKEGIQLSIVCIILNFRALKRTFANGVRFRVAAGVAGVAWGVFFQVDPVVAQEFLVEGGRPRAEIVIAEEPARMTRLAASELQTYVDKMSGARLPIVTEPSAGVVRIFVGISRYTDALGLETEGLKDGAFRMDSGPDWLALLGPDRDYEPTEPWGKGRRRPDRRQVLEAWDEVAPDLLHCPFDVHYRHYYPDQGVWVFDEAGTLNAVYAFLHDLGARWYAPGEIGEVVPRRADIALPAVRRTVKPDFPLRYLHYFYSQHGLGEVGAWNLRLGFNPGHRLLGHVQLCHGMKYVLMRPEMREAHPDFYAIIGGERSDIRPCLSAEGLFEKHVAYIRFLFDHYGEPMVNIDMPDGYGTGCSCDPCRAQKTPERGRAGLTSDLVFGYLDRVAREILRSHPDRMLGALAYSSYRLPPERIETLSPNLAITWSRATKRRTLYHDRAEVDEYLRQREAWLEKLPSGQLYMWESYLNASPGGRALPAVFPRAIAEDIRGLAGISQGDMVEVYKHQDLSDYEPRDHGQPYDAFALNHLNIYVTLRFLWDADTDLDALLEEYYRLYYGPAREEMQAFIEYAEDHWPQARHEIEVVNRILELIQAAEAGVETESIYGRRVARVAELVQPLVAFREQLGRARHEDIPLQRAMRASLDRKTLDGRLVEPGWTDVRTLGLRDLRTGRAPDRAVRTWTRIRRDANALYFGIHCTEPDMANLNPGVDEDGEADLRTGDYVEILLETTTHAYYRIRVNPAGVVEEADMGDGVEELRWQSGSDVAVHRGEDYWSVEIRLPIGGDGLREEEPLSGIDGRMPSRAFPWYFNVGRQRVRDGAVQRLAFSLTGSEAFEVPERFAELWSK